MFNYTRDIGEDARPRSADSAQEVSDFVVSRLVETLIALADCVDRFGSIATDYLACERQQTVAWAIWAYRHSHTDSSRLSRAQGSDGNTHRRSRGQPIIDE